MRLFLSLLYKNFLTKKILSQLESIDKLLKKHLSTSMKPLYAIEQAIKSLEIWHKQAIHLHKQPAKEAIVLTDEEPEPAPESQPAAPQEKKNKPDDSVKPLIKSDFNIK